MAIDNIAGDSNGTQTSGVVSPKDAGIEEKSNGLETSKKVTETMVSIVIKDRPLIFEFYIHDRLMYRVLYIPIGTRC
jgi:formylmethanofuran:tetrahydromethanopterin formyltransferase